MIAGGESFLVSNASVFQVTGTDSQRYLNSRLTPNIRSLTAGNSVLAGALSPQGRTLGFFLVLCREVNSYLVVSEGQGSEEAYRVLTQFLAADDVSVTHLESSQIVHLCGDPEVVPVIEQSGPILTLPRKRTESEFGVDIICESESSLADLRASLNRFGIQEVSSEKETLHRFRAGLPRFPEELNEEFVFLESAPEEAVSRGKGCYVGQEVIERVLALGKVPGVSVLLRKSQSGDAPQKGDALYLTSDLSSKPVGLILRVVLDEESQEFLAFARLRANDLDLSSLPKDLYSEQGSHWNLARLITMPAALGLGKD